MSRASSRNWLERAFTSVRTGRGSGVLGFAAVKRRRSVAMRLEALEERIALSTMMAKNTAELIQDINAANNSGGGTIVLQNTTKWNSMKNTILNTTVIVNPPPPLNWLLVNVAEDTYTPKGQTFTNIS
jgi:hypothetical protein